MYSKSKRIVCLFLCFLILFVGFANVLTVPARAEPITMAASSSVIIWILGLMGITFASLEAARYASTHVSTTEPDIMNWIDEITIPSGDGGGDGGGSSRPDADLLFTALSLSRLGQIMNRLKEIFSSDSDSDLPVPVSNRANFFMSDGTLINGILSTRKNALGNGPSFVSSVDEYSNIIPRENFPGHAQKKLIYSFNFDGVIINYYLEFFSNTKVYVVIERSNSSNLVSCENKYQVSTNTKDPISRVGYDIGIFKNEQGRYYFCPIFGRETVNLNFSEALVNYSYLYCCHSLTDSPEQGIVRVPYKSDAEYSSSQIVDAIYKKIVGSGSFPVTIPGATEDTIKKGQDDIIADIDIKNELEDGGGTVTPDPGLDPDEEFDIDKNKMPQELIYKFPFCVPFDLIDLIGALNAPSQAPIFTIPVKFDFVNYEDEIVIDLSGWEKAAQAIRWGTTLFFLLGLTMVTRKMIKG